MSEQPKDVAAEDLEGAADEAAGPGAPGGMNARRGPLRVALLALLVVAVVTVGSLALGPRVGSDESSVGGDATAVLDAALADGTPVYVLIHSLT